MTRDKRNLYRIHEQHNSGLKLILVKDKQTISATICDYNTLGFSIQVTDSPVTNLKVIDAMRVYFGQTLICEYSNPEVVRVDPELNRMVLNLNRAKEETPAPRDFRVSISDLQRGSLCGQDPFHFGTALYFRVEEISEKGIKVLSSKSNRHILVGMTLKNFSLTIPGLGSFQVDFAVKRAHPTERFLELGGEITSKDQNLAAAIRKYIVANAKLSENSAAQNIVKKQKTYGPLIRLQLASSEKDMEEIYKVRWKSYVTEGKTSAHDWRQMADEYDKRSLVYGVYIGSNIVGTLRLVYGQKSEEFPLEKYFSVRQLKAFEYLGPAQIAEVSRLAIDPLFQGSDILISVFKHLLVEMLKRGLELAFLTATSDLREYYSALGAKQISEPVPHPVLKNETLTLFAFYRERILAGEVNSLAWFKVMSPAFKFLKRHGLIRHPSRGIKHYLTFPFALLRFLHAKRIRKKLRLARANKKSEDRVA